MKTLFFILGLLTTCIDIQAQKYLLPDFKLCVATTKNGGQPIQAEFNYNCVNQSMEFLDGEEIMQLNPISQIDTLFLDNHKMIPYGNHFLDVVYVSPQFCMLIDYKRKIVNEGKVGAMGLKTQGTVENVDFSSFGGRHTENWKKGNEALACKDESTYVYVIKSKMKRFHNEKTLVKIFPKKKDEIAKYIAENKIRFDDIAAVLQLLKFCMD